MRAYAIIAIRRYAAHMRVLPRYKAMLAETLAAISVIDAAAIYTLDDIS